MTFAEAQDFLYSFVNWERTGGRPTQPGDIARFRGFLHSLGDPQSQFRSIWVVGTNGKGSVSAMLASMLRSAGLRVGLYTSPHLVSVTERIQVDGRPIGEDAFAAGIARLREALGPIPEEGTGYRTTFELLTALAMLSFREARVDVAVVEAGLGARLDATSVIDPILSVITPVHLDHTATLGRTLAEIARDKAGAVRAGAALVTAPQTAAVRAVLRHEVSSVGPTTWTRVGIDIRYRGLPVGDGFYGAVISAGNWRVNLDALPLRGEHQVPNAATAVGAIRGIMPDVSPETVVRGLAAARWPGRLEVVSGEPIILLDGAHNPHGVRALARFLGRWDRARGRDLVALVAISTGKDVRCILHVLGQHVKAMVACTAVAGRGVPAEEVAKAASDLGYPAVAIADPKTALAHARHAAGPDGVVVVCGSLYVVGAVASMLGLPRLWWG